MKKSDIQIGDTCRIIDETDKAHNLVGTVVAVGPATCLLHIPGFDGHNGDFKYPGDPEYWYAGYEDLVPVHADDHRIPEAATTLLTTDPARRKSIPIVTGCLDYFSSALAEVAKISKAGNDQHNPGQPLHWSRDKSTDHADTIGRHLMERGHLDVDGTRHSAKLAWRALALLQMELEEAGAQKARGAK